MRRQWKVDHERSNKERRTVMVHADGFEATGERWAAGLRCAEWMVHSCVPGRERFRVYTAPYVRQPGGDMLTQDYLGSLSFDELTELT